MSLNLGMLTAAVFDRATTDPLGDALRALLGAGVDSIIGADELRTDDLPTLPVIALRRGPAPTTERALRVALYTWYAFDDPLEAGWRIDSIITELMRLYDPACNAPLLKMAEQGVIGSVQTEIGPTYVDPLLGLPASWLRLAIVAGA